MPRDSDNAISQRDTIRASQIKRTWHLTDYASNACPAMRKTINRLCSDYRDCWAEAREKIARMTLTIKLDRNWSSFQLANSTPPLSVTGSAIAPSARIHNIAGKSFLHPYMFVATRRAKPLNAHSHKQMVKDIKSPGNNHESRHLDIHSSL